MNTKNTHPTAKILIARMNTGDQLLHFGPFASLDHARTWASKQKYVVTITGDIDQSTIILHEPSSTD